LKRTHSRTLSCLLLASLFASLLYANSEDVLVGLARWLNVGAHPEKTDYVLVLNGDPNARPFVGAALVTSGLASKALLVPVKKSNNSAASMPESHEAARQVMMLRGVPANKIVEAPGDCATTFDEAAALSRFLQMPSELSSTVTLVTSHFHTRRARWIFRQVLGQDAKRVRIVAAPVDGFDESNWWRVEDGFVTYATEYLKLVFYWLRYGVAAKAGCMIAVVGAVVLGIGRRFAARRRAGVRLDG
jgi:uncharacterized SAM-binding protein YcdF (DUF218 family)